MGLENFMSLLGYFVIFLANSRFVNMLWTSSKNIDKGFSDKFRSNNWSLILIMLVGCVYGDYFGLDVSVLVNFFLLFDVALSAYTLYFVLKNKPV